MPQWLIDFGNWLLDILKTMANTILTMAKDAMLFIFEQMLILITFILDGMAALFSGLDITSYMSGIPSGTAWVLSQIGIGQALSMIIAAITIRFTLQLIPFVRLGS